jgi:hypothetical protein
MSKHDRRLLGAGQVSRLPVGRDDREPVQPAEDASRSPAVPSIRAQKVIARLLRPAVEAFREHAADTVLHLFSTTPRADACVTTARVALTLVTTVGFVAVVGHAAQDDRLSPAVRHISFDRTRSPICANSCSTKSADAGE